jgi:hypothetical protein
MGPTRYRCPSCGARFSLLSGTIFANAKLPLDRIMKIVEIMCHKVFSTLSGWQDCVMLSGCVWIDEMYFENIRAEHEDGKPREKGLSKDKVCLIVAIDS